MENEVDVLKRFEAVKAKAQPYNLELCIYEGMFALTENSAVIYRHTQLSAVEAYVSAYDRLVGPVTPLFHRKHRYTKDELFKALTLRMVGILKEGVFRSDLLSAADLAIHIHEGRIQGLDK